MVNFDTTLEMRAIHYDRTTETYVQSTDLVKEQIVSLDSQVSKMYLFSKRFIDIFASLLALIVLSPFLLIISLIIKFSDFGPVFFIQNRIGLNGKNFRIIKFRSMKVNAEEELEKLRALNEAKGPLFKIKHDPRVTKIGRFIRKTSIDELPQLINILIGNMTIVGPRPPLPSEGEQYTEYQMKRLYVKPGLTCYWQCSGRSKLGFDQMVELDIKYINERSFFIDMKLILLTIPAVLFNKGAY